MRWPGTGIVAGVLWGTALLGLLAGGRALAETSSEVGPTGVVQSFNATLLAALKGADELGYQGRYDLIEPALETTYDIPFMAEKTLGRKWKALEPSEQSRWTELFRELITANYASRFVGYSGQSFVELGEEPGARDTIMVATRLINPGGENVDMTYRLRDTSGGWKVIDVYLKGTVSELALRRSEFSSVLDREGFGPLVTTIEGKIDELESGATPDA